MPINYKLEGADPAAHQRRPEYARDDDWILPFLRAGRVAHIGTRWDDQTFVTPTSYFFDEADHSLIFHSNIQGRLRANIERHPLISAEISETGRMLPSNTALEFSLQYRCVMIFGKARLMEGMDAKRRVMHALISKYFPGMEAGREYREVTEKDLQRTTVYALEIEAWSGKENWKDRAQQIDEWPQLPDNWLV